jgi:hypothetical protein
VNHHSDDKASRSMNIPIPIINRGRPADYEIRQPDRAAALAELRARVRGLTAAGAVDSGTPDVIDRLVESWQRQWHAALVQQANRRRAQLQRARVRAQRALAKKTARAEHANTELDRARHIFDRLCALPPHEPATNDHHHTTPAAIETLPDFRS